MQFRVSVSFQSSVELDAFDSAEAEQRGRQAFLNQFSQQAFIQVTAIANAARADGIADLADATRLSTTPT